MVRAKAVVRAVLPPVVVSATRPLRRRVRLLRGSQPRALRLSDGVVELKLLERDDRDTIARAAHDPEISRRFALLKARPSEYFEYFWEGSRSGRAVAFAICDVGGKCQGLITVERRHAGRADLGYWLLPEGRGRGRALRALRLVSRWALSQPGIARLQLWTAPDNPASQRVAESSGFQREGVLRSYQELDGRREDAVFFSLLPGDLDEAAETESTLTEPSARARRRTRVRHELGGSLILS